MAAAVPAAQLPADGPARALRRRRATGLLVATLVLAGVIALFFLPAFVGDGQFLHRDSGRLHHTLKAWLAGELRRGNLPQWNPWGGLGYPLVSGAVDAVLHPFNALFLVLPFEAAFKAWVLLSFLAAGSGGFFWARQLGNAFGPALASGLAFMLSGFLVSSTDNVQYLSTLAMLPWMLGAAHAWLRDGGPARLLLLGAASALAAAAGDVQGWGFTTAALPLYGALLGRSAPGGVARGALRGALASVACAVAAAPFILPVVAWLTHSTRGEAFDAYEYERFNLIPFRALELLLPRLLRDPRLGIWSELYETYSGLQTTPLPWVMSEYVGASTLLLAFLGATRRRAAAVLVALAALALWTAMGSYAGFGQLARHVPVIGAFRYWEKAAAGVHLLVSAAAGFGVAALAEGGPPSRRFLVACAGLAASLLAGFAAASAWPATLAAAVVRDGHLDHATLLASNLTRGALHAGLTLSVLSLVALVAVRGRSPRLVAGLAALVLACDLGVANADAYRLYPLETVAREGPIAAYVSRAAGGGRVLTPFPLWVSPATPLGAAGGPRSEQLATSAWVMASRSLASGFNVGVVGNFEAYTGMVPARQMRFRRRTGLYHQLPGAGLWNVAWLVVPGDPARARQMGLEPPYRVVAADPFVGLTLVEVPHRPRAYLAASVEAVDRRGAMEFVLGAGAVRSDRSVVEGPVPAGYRAPRGDVRLVREDSDDVVLEATSDGPALVVLNDGFAPGWTATVDGRPADILPANYMARGVWIGAGTHAIAFAYRTPWLREALALSAAGALGLAAWALRARRKRATAGGGA